MSKHQGKPKKHFKSKRSKRFKDVEALDKRIATETPPSDIYYYK